MTQTDMDTIAALIGMASQSQLELISESLESLLGPDAGAARDVLAMMARVAFAAPSAFGT